MGVGICLQGWSASEGLPGGICIEGGLPRGFCMKGKGGLHPGGLGRTPTELEKRAVGILLKCFLVSPCMRDPV